MKKIILALLIAASSVASAKPQTKPDSVWICTGKYSKSYHARAYCKGLRNCKADEMKVSLADAINKWHRKPCGYCER